MVGPRDGSATVELIVACTLVGVTALSVAAGTTLAARLASRAELQDAAVTAATDILDSLASVTRPENGSTSRGRHTLEWTVQETEPDLYSLTLHVHWLQAGTPDSLRFDMLLTPPPQRIR